MFRAIIMPILFVIFSVNHAAGQTHLQKAGALLDLIEYPSTLMSLQSEIAGMVKNGQIPEGSSMALRWNAAAEQHFDGKRMVLKVTAGLAASMSEADLDGLIELYSTDFAKKISALEFKMQNEGSSADQEQKGKELVASLSETNPERLRQYIAMIETIGGLDSYVALALNIQQAILIGASLNGLINPPLSEAQISDIITASYEEIRREVSIGFLSTSAYTYQSLSDEEIAAYLDLAAEPLIVRLYSLLVRYESEVITAEFAAFTAKLGETPEQQEL